MDCRVFGRADILDEGRWVARDSARETADCLTEPVLEDGLTVADALDDGRVDALESGLMNGLPVLELLGRVEALDGGLRFGFMNIRVSPVSTVPLR